MTTQRSGWMFDGIEGAGAELVRPEGVMLTPAGRIAMVSGDAAIRQSILMLLTTLPGERVMRPDFGCPLHRLLFAPNDATTAGLAIHYVRQALVRFEPRVEIVSLDAGPPAAGEPGDNNASKLIIALVYRVKSSNRQASLDLEVDLFG